MPQFLQKSVHARANGLVVNVEQADVLWPSALPILRGGSPSWLLMGCGSTLHIAATAFSTFAGTRPPVSLSFAIHERRH